jgi:hypothetical protein
MGAVQALHIGEVVVLGGAGPNTQPKSTEINVNEKNRDEIPLTRLGP